ncbi:MAG TPA: hypothetical protein VFW93_12235, partial [Aquabacterium sp.]|uniref:hypothetical protein n=1 Tax=Aquabacterium sp. TaxID=1872578 RepID=UPI002E2FD864
FYVLSFLLLIWTAIQRDDALMLGVSLSLGACFASLMVFGILNELRLYQPFNWCLMYLLVGCLAPVRGKTPVDATRVAAE